MNRNLSKNNAIKVSIGMDVEFMKESKEGNVIINEAHLRPKVFTINNRREIKKCMQNQRDQLNSRIDRFTNEGSGWTVNGINRHLLAIWPYKPLAARTFIGLGSRTPAKQ